MHRSLAAVMLFAATVASAAANSTVPRAWLVTKGGAQAVLVGESHVGNPVEYDSYYETGVKPSYAAAEVAVMETYFGPEQQHNEAFERGAPCFPDPKGVTIAQTRPAFDALISATRDNHLEVPNWLDHWEVVPDFLFTTIYLESFTKNSLGASYEKAIDSQLGLGVSYRLRAKGTPAKKVVGLDTAKDLRTQFCSASATHRAHFVAENVSRMARLLRLKQSDPSYASFGKLAGPVGEFVTEAVNCVDREVPCSTATMSSSSRLLQEKGLTQALDRGTFEIMLKKRTHAWLPRITNTIVNHRRSFIIVGVLHLPDLRSGARVEPGLISLLRKRGLVVTPIASAYDINATFLSPSWFQRMRSALRIR